MTRTYIPDTHDPVLTGLITGWKLADAEAAERMAFPLPIIRANRERLGLAENKPLLMQPPKQRPDALRIAEQHLKGFNRESMTLKGRPIKLDEVMKLTNAVLVKKGMPMVLYCDRWRVEA